MISIRQKNLFFILLCCVGSIFVCSGQAGGYQCSPEPTDDLIKYGDTVTCTINPIGDTDKFRFQGSNGDTVAVQAARQSGGNPCIQLFDPDGMIIGGTCGGSTARMTLVWIRPEYTQFLSLSGAMIPRWIMGYP